MLVLLDEGYEIQLGSRRLCVLDVRGHSPGHVALYDREAGILFGGDAVLFETTPGVSPGAPSGNGYENTVSALRRISDLPIDLLLPGHGEPRRRIEVKERAEILLKHHQTRLELVTGIVSRNPGIGVVEITVKLIGTSGLRGGGLIRVGSTMQYVTELTSHLVDRGVLARVAEGESRGFRMVPSEQ